LVSLGLHAAAVTAVLLLLHGGLPVVASVEKPTEVELVMEEHKGDLRPTASPSPSPPAPAASQAHTQPAKAPDTAVAKAASPPVQVPVEAQPDVPEETAASAKEASPAPPTPAQQEGKPVPAPPATETPVQEATREAAPVPPAAQPAPVISLQGTDSPSNARAFGDRVIPARPDAVFHNRPPEYPDEAALNGQQGTVVVMVHVSPAGMAVGVELLRSSGYLLLDRAAQEAVLRWRFMPAVKDGQPVASNMTMGFVFDDN